MTHRTTWRAARNLLPQLWIDRNKCARWVTALQDYRSTWDETLRIFSCRPFHNWAAHACDSLRYFATGPDDDADDYTPPEPTQLYFNPFMYARER